MDTQKNSYRQQYLVEARDILESVGEAVLKAESDPTNADLLNSIFRGVHTIKGSSAMFDMDSLGQFAHHLEGLLNGLRSGEATLTPDAVDVILKGLDALGGMLDSITRGEEPESRDDLVASFERMSGKFAPAGPTPSSRRMAAQSGRHGLGILLDQEIMDSVAAVSGSDHDAPASKIFLVELRYSSEHLANGFDPAVFLRNLKSSCLFYRARSKGETPECRRLQPLDLYLRPAVIVVTGLSAQAIRDLAFDETLVETTEIERPCAGEDSQCVASLMDFVETAAGRMEDVERAALDYGKTGADLDALFQAVRNLREEADLAGVQHLSLFLHVVETLLAKLRAGRLDLGAEGADLIPRVTDDLGAYLDRLWHGVSAPCFESILGRIMAMLDEPCPLDAALPESVQAFWNQSRRGSISATPETAGPTDESLAERKPLGRILVEDRKITEADLDHALAKQGSSRMSDPCATTELKVMRVDESKIDGFANMIGELVIARNAYDFLVGGLDAGNGLDASGLKSLKDNLRLFSRITGELQRGVMTLRMTPIRSVFQKYSRVVRDISRRQGKLIDFRIEGGEIEVDKKVADLLSEPLIHMIRNSCDHGLETPEERIAAGKPEQGSLILRASREGSELVVRIIDDGRGLDRRKLHEKALRLGIPVGGPEDGNLLDVIFLPGFSTKEEVSDLSGRGVGMDVVKSTLASLGGAVCVASEQGRGTTIAMNIPMSLGVSVALQVVAGGQQYAIPIENVLETVKTLATDVHDFGAAQGIHYRGEILPVARLERLLHRKTGPVRESDGDEERLVVVLASAKGKYGLIIDRLLRNCEIAIKPVPAALASLAFLGGVTILGDGRVLLVLNPEHLL